MIGKILDIVGAAAPNEKNQPEQKKEIDEAALEEVLAQILMQEGAAAPSEPDLRSIGLFSDVSEEKVAEAWEAAMKDVINVKDQKDIPELNLYQCGTYKMHSLDDAKAIAQAVLRKDIDIMDNDALALDLSRVDQ